ncbi:MAG TPA: hypothetical protein DHU72_05745, partial [Rikenellaceae bacterium]|nr:hypothetical protein [Rikenellaceae bacterium]
MAIFARFNKNHEIRKVFGTWPEPFIYTDISKKYKMRKQIVAGNWKMNTTKPEGKELAQEVAALSAGFPENVGLIVAPPFTHLCAVNKALAGSRVELSAQNCADHE